MQAGFSLKRSEAELVHVASESSTAHEMSLPAFSSAAVGMPVAAAGLTVRSVNFFLPSAATFTAPLLLGRFDLGGRLGLVGYSGPADRGHRLALFIGSCCPR